MNKNRANTEQRLITAVGEILAQNGFAKVGVNAVARQAGVDKVLIYRYFDSLDGLIRAYAASEVFWPSADELLGNEEEQVKLEAKSFHERFVYVFERYANAIRKRPLTLEILAWETVERNSLTIALEDIREALGLQLTERLQQVDSSSTDWQAISALLSAAIHYLAIRARKIRFYNGIDLSSEEGWERLMASVRTMIIKN